MGKILGLWSGMRKYLKKKMLANKLQEQEIYNCTSDTGIDEDMVKVIKISKEAIFEFIYENFIDEADEYLDVNSLEVITTFDMDWENGQFIFCAYKAEDKKGNVIHLPEEVDLQKLMRNIPDTTSSMFQEDRYKVYTKEEMVKLSKK